jgi:hypothetical protein
MSKISWPLPLTRKGPSARTQCNFLWNQDNIYIMDNHRLALWCWLQHLNESSSYSLFHIDAHYDTDPKLLGLINESEITALKSVTLAQYMDFKISKEHLIEWDNYLPLLEKLYPKTKDLFISSTHHIGLKGNFDKELEIYELYRYLDDQLISKKNWLFNIDFDYFFARDYKATPLMDKDYITKIFSTIKLAYDEGRILCLTAALSPECCGSWENAEMILKPFCEVFEIDYKQFFLA